MAVKKVTQKFLNEHYFSTIWPYLSFKKKEKILDIIAEGKGVVPYELIVDMQSLKDLKMTFGKRLNFLAN